MIEEGDDPSSEINVVIVSDYSEKAVEYGSTKVQRAKLFPMMKKCMIDDDGLKQITEMKLSTDAKCIKVLYDSLELADENPNHRFFFHSEYFAENVNSFCTVSAESVQIFDQKFDKPRLTLKNLNIRGGVDIDQSYLYTISDATAAKIQVINHEKDNEEIPQTQRCNSAGFYVYDLSLLSQGRVERYKLASAIGGQSNFVGNNRLSSRFSFI